jgi:Domain of unknown function (DUF4159)
MPFRAKCPTCGRVQSIPEEDLGKAGFCRACGARYEIPQVAPQASNEPAPPESVSGPPTSQPSSNPPVIQLSPPHRNYLAMGILVLIVLGMGIIIGRMTLPAQNQVETARASSTPPTTVPTQIIISAPPPATKLPSIIPANVPPAVEPTTAPTVVATHPTALPTTHPISSIMPTTQAAAGPPGIHPVRPNIDTIALEDQIGQSIDRGVNYLLGEFRDGRLRGTDGTRDGGASGLDALCVYALLQAGEATHDERLGPHSPLVDQMLKMLKAAPIEQSATYSRSLRAAALGVYNRGEDRAALRADAEWLMRATMDGAYTYGMPAHPASEGENRWDNSNSQYGALGVWAASEAGDRLVNAIKEVIVEVPNAYWQKVEDHWLNCQLPNGEWGYSPRTQNGRLSMTVAGITMLFVTQDQLGAIKVPTTLGRPPFIPALERGLHWLETDDNSVSLPFDHKTYNLYGLERAALASGFKYFGTHDWYRELASNALIAQMPDGAWGGEQLVDTSFTLLFLSRGRHPILMNKLRFDGYWANRPRDIANLTRFASYELERPLNWQVVSLKSDWTDWMDSPILYIASHEPPKLTDSDYDKLRSFAENGGLIFTHADGGSAPFNRFVADLSKRLFPDYPLQTLLPDDEIYSAQYNKIDPKPPLQAVSNGSRLLLINSSTELNKAWQLRDYKPHPADFQIGMNIFIYAAGKTNFRNKLRTTVVPDPQVTPVGTVPIARLQYPGAWNPEPAGWPRFSRQFLGETSVKLDITPVDLRDLRFTNFTVAHLTGTKEIHVDAFQVKAITDFVDAGGTLLIDACGGSAAFGDSVRNELLAQAFPHTLLQPLPNDHSILLGTGPCMAPVTPHLRPRAAELQGSPVVSLEYLQEGRGTVIFCPVDLSTALLGTNTYAVLGCDPESAHELMKNAVLWSIEK